MKNKQIRRYFKIAKTIAENGVPCLSRGIGSVIVNPKLNCIVSTGYNGTGPGMPDCDSYQHLKEYVWPQLTQEEKEYVAKNNHTYLKDYFDNNLHNEYVYQPEESERPNVCVNDPSHFANVFNGCKQCPRKLVGAKSGARLELCECNHSERNAILNAAKSGYSTNGCMIVCWCGTPCILCTAAIVMAGIKEVWCLDTDRDSGNNSYEFWRSEWYFKNAGVKVNRCSQEWIFSEEDD